MNLLLERERLHSDDSWMRNEHLVKQWLDALKAWEQKETFDHAFKDDRMTIRGMGVQGKHKDAVEAERKMYSLPVLKGQPLAIGTSASGIKYHEHEAVLRDQGSTGEGESRKLRARARRVERSEKSCH